MVYCASHGCRMARLQRAGMCKITVLGAVALRVAVLSMLLLIGITGARAQSASVVLFTGHLNADCIADTVRGRAYGLHTYLPEVIVWGKPSPQTPCADTVQGGHTVGSVGVPLTPLVYPAWEQLRGSVSFQRYNRNDSLDDMILYVWGQYSTPSGVVRDTARAVVLFGQRDLDLQHLILLDSIALGWQAIPFCAMDLYVQRDLVEPLERDVSGEVSYELLSTVRSVPVGDSQPPPHPLRNVQEERSSAAATVRMYPNPAEFWSRVQASPLAPGEYILSVLAVNGEVYHRQVIQIGEGKELERELDVSSLPSGHYMVRIYSSGAYVGAYPLVIVR